MGEGIASSGWGYQGEDSAHKNNLTDGGRGEKNVHFATSSPPPLLLPPPASSHSPYDAMQALVTTTDTTAAPSSSSSSSSSSSLGRHRIGDSISTSVNRYPTADNHHNDYGRDSNNVNNIIRLDDCFSGVAGDIGGDADNDTGGGGSGGSGGGGSGGSGGGGSGGSGGGGSRGSGGGGSGGSGGSGGGGTGGMPPPTEPYPPLGNKRARTGRDRVQATTTTLTQHYHNNHISMHTTIT